MPDVYGTILEAIHPHLGARAEAVLEEGLKRLGKRPSELTPADGAHLLKGLVYRELQARMRPEEARRLVEGVLAKIEGQGARLAKLEQGLKRFGLYVDWPEVARLRALVNRLRQSPDPGLLAEGEELLEALDEKMEEALLRQAKDLAHLEEALERVRHLGGPKVRRLESLVETIRQAQKEGILAQAEVERARSLALELRKFLESSAVKTPTLPEIIFETQETPPETPPRAETPSHPSDVFLTVEEASDLEGELVVDLEALSQEASQRILALEVEEEKRKLEELLSRFAPLVERATVSPLLAEVQALLDAGTPVGEKLKALEEAFQEAERNLRAEKRARLIQLQEALRLLSLPEEAKLPLERALQLAEETLEEGGYPDLLPLEEELRRLEEEARRKAEEEKRLLQEKEALVEELKEKGEAFRPLLEELKALPLEALPQRLPEVRARYAELLKAQGEEAALRAKLTEAAKALEALKPEALALGLKEKVAEAEALLAQGSLPDLGSLRKSLEEAKAQARQEALLELGRLQALAERFRGFGGEGVLRAIAEEKGKPLPDPTPIARALEALKRRMEVKREELTTRLTAFFQAYARLEGFQSETGRRLKALLPVLRSAQEKLPRLGPQGLLQVERTLSQAEALLRELEREQEAAKAVLQEIREIRGEEIEALLGVFDQGRTPAQAKAPETPSPKVLEADLAPLRLPGVEVLGYLGGALPLPKEPLEALVQALDQLDKSLGQTRGPAAILLGEKALVLAPRKGRTLVALLEKTSLSAFLLELTS
ncbi:coiled-coil domain-containing protein [Thermus antranikianii]